MTVQSREILGLDVGLKRTGVARASSVAQIAEPLMTVATSEVIKTIKKYAAEHPLEAVVVGLPRNLSGEDTAQTQWVRAWANEAKGALGVTLYWQDEALTTIKAADLKAKPKAADLDAISAAAILQDFLDSPQTERVVC